jgi:hypothetical protein
MNTDNLIDVDRRLVLGFSIESTAKSYACPELSRIVDGVYDLVDNAYIQVQRGIIWSITIRIRSQDKYQISYQGKQVDLCAGTVLSQLVQCLGAAYWIHKDEGYSIAFFEFEGIEIQVSWNSSDIVESVEIGVPELGNPEARREYGVTAPWQWGSA